MVVWNCIFLKYNCRTQTQNQIENSENLSSGSIINFLSLYFRNSCLNNWDTKLLITQLMDFKSLVCMYASIHGWSRHDMETIYDLLVNCERTPVGFPHKGPVNRCFGVFLNNCTHFRTNSRVICLWSEISSLSCDGNVKHFEKIRRDTTIPRSSTHAVSILSIWNSFRSPTCYRFYRNLVRSIFGCHGLFWPPCVSARPLSIFFTTQTRMVAVSRKEVTSLWKQNNV